MLRRIKWDDGWEEDREGALGAGFGLAPPRARPECRLVWRGLLAKAYFTSFKVEQPRTPEAARKYLADRGVAHYWDVAASFSAEGQGLADALEAESDLLGEEALPVPRGKAPATNGKARAEHGGQGRGPMAVDDDDDD
jgi:hypothetical protein